MKRIINIIFAALCMFISAVAVDFPAGALQSETYGEASEVPDEEATSKAMGKALAPETDWLGRSYCIYEWSGNWDEAKEFCKSMGGRLAVIEWQEQNDFLYQYVKENRCGDVYFGLTDCAQESKWTWVTGRQLSGRYSNWHTGEPNNQDGNEDYAMFFHNYTDGTWNDGDFEGTKAILCEWRSIFETYPDEYIYTDVAPEGWYYKAVSRVKDLGLMTGYNDGSFKPRQELSRAECIALISRFCNDQPADAITSSGFKDVADDSWYMKYVAVRGNEFGGAKDGYFHPDVPCTREDMAVSLYRAFGYIGYASTAGFNDSDQVSSEYPYQYAVSLMKTEGIMNGDEYGNFNPQKSLTRAEAAQILFNLNQNGKSGISLTGEEQPVKTGLYLMSDTQYRMYIAQATATNIFFSANFGDVVEHEITQTAIRHGKEAIFEFPDFDKGENISGTIRFDGAKAILSLKNHPDPDCCGDREFKWVRKELEKLSSEQLDDIRKELNVPGDLEVQFQQEGRYSWDSGERKLAYISILHEGKQIAGAGVDFFTGEIVKDIFSYAEK